MSEIYLRLACKKGMVTYYDFGDIDGVMNDIKKTFKETLAEAVIDHNTIAQVDIYEVDRYGDWEAFIATVWLGDDDKAFFDINQKFEGASDLVDFAEKLESLNVQ